jgi:uncharacterized protein
MISSPCIKICAMDPRGSICTGCGRTLDEIARWGGMSEDERVRIMQQLSERLNRHKQTA